MKDYALIKKATLTKIGDSIRRKTGQTSLIDPEVMDVEIDNIQTVVGESDKPFNAASYINGTLTEVDDIYGVIKSVGIYYSVSNYYPQFSYSVGVLSLMNNSRLSYVNLPECRALHRNAFMSCYALETVSLPKCEVVEYNAFGSCEALSRIDLPACKSISTNAFSKTSPASVKFDVYFADFCNVGYQSILTKSYQSNYYWSANGNPYEVLARQSSSTLHSKCRVIGVQNDDTTWGSLYGEGVKWVCRNAFANFDSTFSNLNSNFRSISLPNCESIGDNAFYYCKNIQSLYLPKCSYIGYNAFYGASSSTFTDLTGVNATYIGAGAFYNARSISTANWSIIECLGQNAFYGNTIFTELPSELTNCSFLCGFAGSPVLEKAHNSVAKTVCFSYCSVLSDISFPACEVLLDYAFYKCPNLTDIELPNCTTLASYVFSEVINLSLPKCSVIPTRAMTYCSNLKSLCVPECTTIKYSAFLSCYSLETLDLPKCVTIETHNFSSCSMLSSISVPNLRYIGPPLSDSTYNGGIGYVFSGATLDVLEFPALETISSCRLAANVGTVKFYNLKTLGTSTFYSASSTYSIYIYASSVPVMTGTSGGTFSGSPFYGNGSGRIYVPASLYAEYRIATNWAGLNSNIFVSM